MSTYDTYYLTDEQIQSMISSAQIVFDTSALLSIYGLSQSARDDIFDRALDYCKERLWLPERVSFEFDKNRLTVAKKSLTSYDNLLTKNVNRSNSGYVKKIVDCAQSEITKSLESINGQYKTLKETCKDNQRHPIIAESEFSKFDTDIVNFTNELQEFINQAIGFQQHIATVVNEEKEKIEEQIKNDDIPQKILSIFEIGPELSYDELFQIACEGEIRYRMEIPPGYEDAKSSANKHGLAVYGDLILWKQLLRHVSKTNVATLLVSNDMKPDWMDVEKKGFLALNFCKNIITKLKITFGYWIFPDFFIL